MPDRVITEPARQFDPVTAEYDEKHDRPKHFWRDMSDEEFEIRREAARKAAKDFPLGKNPRTGPGQWMETLRAAHRLAGPEGKATDRMTEAQSTKSAAYSMEREAIYAVTAYNSQNEKLPKREKSTNNDSYFTKVARGNSLGLPKGSHCRSIWLSGNAMFSSKTLCKPENPTNSNAEKCATLILWSFGLHFLSGQFLL